MAVVAVAFAASGRTGFVVMAILIGLVALLVLVGWWLAALYLLGALLIGSDRLGIGWALDPRKLFALGRANLHASLLVALNFGAATIVFAFYALVIGLIIPFCGLFLSTALTGLYIV